ncbi:MAG: hypothetical protein WD336_03980 [Trueperaceae bacterium]
MRKLAILLVTAVALTLGTASAQNFSATYDTSQYAGGAIGLPFTGYYGISDVFAENTDLRMRVSVWPFGIFYAAVGADFLLPIVELTDDGMLNLYAGGGPSIGFASFLGTGGIYGDLTGLIGLDVRFSQELSVFVEAGGGVSFASVGGVAGGIGFAPRGAVGVLYHF